MADDKLQKMVEIAETNILQLFQDDTSMQKFLKFMQKNEHLTYYAASMIDGTDYADTYDGWKERGYQVNAGEHGTPIFVKRSTVKRKFIDENGTIRNLSSASYIERQKIKNGELKVSSNLASYYTVEHLFSKEQTNAKNVDFEVEKRPSILTYEDIKTVVEESTDDILDVDFAMPSPIIKCATGYATYMLCISDNVIDADLYKKAKKEFAEYKDKLSLSEQKLVLNSVLKIVRSDHTRELLNVLKNEIRESKKITSSNDVSAQNEPVSEPNEPGDTFVLSDLKEEKIKSKNKIEDFGKKIGGARKDLWRQRGLMVDDLKKMNLGEKNKFATKNYIFPKPDYQKMVDEGLPVRTAYFIKTIRDAMPTKPVFSILEDVTDELTEKKIEGYVAFISELKDALLKVKTDDDILNFYDYQIKDVYVKNESTYNVTPTEKSHGCMTNKLLKACQVSRFELLEFDNKIKKNKFCYTEKQLKYDGFEICKFDDSCAIDEDRGRTVIKRNIGSGTYFYYPEGELADKDSWIKDTYFVLYKNRLIANSLTEGQAQNTVDKMADGFATIKKEGKETSKKTRKKKYVPEQLKHIERTGPSNGINEYNHADGQMYLDTFGFAGGEFGNWMNETDRQASLDFGYDALLDLADALEIDPKDISFDGELSIAFGSRGIAGAAAHYEPLRQVINLTKMHGAGSLAHEWGHALDNIISKKIKGKGIDTWLTDCKINDAVSSVKELVNSMKYRPATLEDKQRMKDKRCNESEKLFQDDFKWFFKSYTEELVSKFESNIEKLLKGDSFNDDSARKLMDEIGDEYKMLSGNELRENAKNSLIGDMKEFNDRYNQTVDEIICPSQKTEYYKNSIEFDRSYRKESKGYWQDKKEMFARAFACYVKDKLDYRSDYLCGHADSYVTIVDGKIIKAFPEGEERKAFNKGFDKVIDQLKEIGVLHHNRNQVRRKSR